MNKQTVKEFNNSRLFSFSQNQFENFQSAEQQTKSNGTEQINQSYSESDFRTNEEENLMKGVEIID